jgi:hypothetical protein
MNFLNQIKKTRMTNKALTQEQYDFLNTERAAFDQLQALGYCKNLQPAFLKQAVLLHISLFGMNFNANCPSCCKDGLRRLGNKLKEYDNNRS